MCPKHLQSETICFGTGLNFQKTALKKYFHVATIWCSFSLLHNFQLGMLTSASQVQSPSVNGMDQVGSEFWTSPSLNIAVTPQEKLVEVGCWKKIHPFDFQRWLMGCSSTSHGQKKTLKMTKIPKWMTKNPQWQSATGDLFLFYRCYLQLLVGS